MQFRYSEIKIATNDHFKHIDLVLYKCYEDGQCINQNQRVHSCYLKRFHHALGHADNKRRGSYYPCSVLHSRICSMWTKLVYSVHNPSPIQDAGLYFCAFQYLLVWFAPIYKQCTCCTIDGRPDPESNN